MATPRKVSQEYWAKRAEELENQYHGNSEAVKRALEREYVIASREVQNEINAWVQRYAQNNNLTIADARKQLSAAELKEFKWTVQDYIKYGQENAINGKWMAELERASARVHISRQDALLISIQQQVEKLFGTENNRLENHLGAVFEDSYYRNAYTIQKGIGVGEYVKSLDSDKVKRVLSKPWAPDGSNFSSRIWVDKNQLMNTVESELSQMIIRGDSPDRAIKNIAHRFDVSKSNAGNLVMTEAAYFASESQREVYNQLGVKNFRFIATLDDRTCEICGPMDRQIIPESERKAGINSPPLHPRCRCTTIPAFEDMDDWGANRAARDIEEKYQEIPANITFEQWKKEFVNEPVVMKMVGTKASNGAKVNSVSSHFFDQMKLRKFSSDAAVDALQKPLNITKTKIDDKGNPSRRYVGEKATIVYNPESGQVVTGWKTGKKDLKKSKER